MNSAQSPQALLITGGGWSLPRTARALHNRNALAGLWVSNKNNIGLPPDKFRRCWPFHLAVKPFYHLTPWWCWVEKPFYVFFPLWKWWLKRQAWPACNVVHAVMGFATEPFDWADKHGALKVLEAPNSHPTSYYGYHQRECDLWCPGEKMPIPRSMFARMNRELDRADMVIFGSEFVRDTMLANGIPKEKLFVNPYGVDTSIFVPRKTVPRKPRFIIVGQISLRKGHQYLFRAFQMVKRVLPDAELICVGDYRPDFKKERPRWEGTFTRYQNVPVKQLAELLAGSTAFVFPSIEEGFAAVIIEAMGAGLPVIASYESGATTLVENGVEGFIINPRDPQQLADAMIRLARDSDLCQRMGESAHRRGAVSNTWQDYGDRLLAEYSRRLNLPVRSGSSTSATT